MKTTATTKQHTCTVLGLHVRRESNDTHTHTHVKSMAESLWREMFFLLESDKGPCSLAYKEGLKLPEASAA